MNHDGRLDASVLALSPAALEAEATFIARWLRETVGGTLRRKGCVVAMSGGIDSTVCTALAVRALGRERVLGLMLPERDSSGASGELAARLAAHLGIATERHDLAPALAALGCYTMRDAAYRRVFPAYGEGWRSKILLTGGLQGGLNHFRLVVRDAQGQEFDARLGAREYLEIVAATNMKQRARKLVEYTHADRLNYAVVGTPNRLEYDQGFFVKNGDGAADLKPIAHLYKTQVYAMARHLGLPAELCGVTPTTDTYSLAQGQDEFYFALPYAQMDLALWALDHGFGATELAPALGIDEARAAHVLADIAAKRRAARYLHAPALTARPVDSVHAHRDAHGRAA